MHLNRIIFHLVKYLSRVLLTISPFIIAGLSCIRSNQSAIHPRKQQEIEIKNEHKDIATKEQTYFTTCHSYIPRTARIFKDYSDSILD